MAELTAVEKIKAASRLLRGTLEQSLADPLTGSLREDDTHLLKFHGSYQQDDRDLRDERRLQKLEPAYSFMVRARLPGGICTPAQWLAIDQIARDHANDSIRLTTRQSFQLHGIVKRELRETIAQINRAMIDTIAACGDVNRNVMAAAHAGGSRVQAEVVEWSRRLSEHLLPRSRAYHEIWLNGERLGHDSEVEPILGATYLPRKFKAAIALPPINDVDIFSQDLGFIAILEAGRLVGFNVAVGGGMGMTHGESTTYARLASVVGFLPPERLLEVAEAVVTIQRDFGDRSNRKHARLKYTIDDRGLAWFETQLSQRLGGALAAPATFEFTSLGDRFGWQQTQDGSCQVTLRIPAGRVADRESSPWLTGLREIARLHSGHFQITPNQNLTIADVHPAARTRIEALLCGHKLDLHARATPLHRDALACVAMPTCPLAMAEAERYLPSLIAQVDAALTTAGLAGESLILRITGCPNGCARPQLAEIGLIGKAPGRYNLYLGGDAHGQRLNRLHRENLDEPSILAELRRLFAAWASARRPQERFGDFVVRSGVVGSAVSATAGGTS